MQSMNQLDNGFQTNKGYVESWEKLSNWQLKVELKIDVCITFGTLGLVKEFLSGLFWICSRQGKNDSFIFLFLLPIISLIRSIIALHNLINNKINNKEAEKKLETKAKDAKANASKEEADKKKEAEANEAPLVQVIFFIIIILWWG